MFAVRCECFVLSWRSNSTSMVLSSRYVMLLVKLRGCDLENVCFMKGGSAAYATVPKRFEKFFGGIAVESDKLHCVLPFCNEKI